MALLTLLSGAALCVPAFNRAQSAAIIVIDPPIRTILMPHCSVITSRPDSGSGVTFRFAAARTAITCTTSGDYAGVSVLGSTQRDAEDFAPLANGAAAKAALNVGVSGVRPVKLASEAGPPGIELVTATY